MRVYYVSSGLQGCYFVRCLMPLMANGWDGDQTSINREHKTPESKAQAAMNSDVVVFHRAESSIKLELARMLKKQGKKIVFDNDDTYKDDNGLIINKYLSKEKLEKGLKELDENLDAFMREADLITCSTETLKKEYEQINPNVIVIPNCVDPYYFGEPQRNETDIVRIGIVGSIAITADLEICKPIVEHFQGRKDVRIVVFSLPAKDRGKLVQELYYDEYKFIEGADVEWVPFVEMEHYYNALNDLKLDIAIIPRSNTYFNKCKSNLKFLEMSMFEIPVIAQGFPDGSSPYQDPEDAKHMKIVVDNKDWIPTIEAMIKDKEGRREQGRKAREYVLSRYNIDDHADRWENAYKSLYERRDSSTNK